MRNSSKNYNNHNQQYFDKTLLLRFDITGYILGFFIIASILSLMVHNVFNQNHTYTNIFFVFPILLVLLFVFLRELRSIFLAPELKILILFLVWILFVYFIRIPVNTESLIKSSIRLSSLLLQILLYFISFKYFYRNSKGLYQIWLYTATSSIFFLIMSNFFNHNINVLDVMKGVTRYEGISGPNAHGIISALAIISLTALLTNKKKNILKKFIIFFFISYASFNLLITGSRWSLFIIFVYIMIYSFKIKYSLFVIFITIGTVLLIGIDAYLGSSMLRTVFVSIYHMFPYFRLSEYSIIRRIVPFIWWFEKAKRNFFMPYGLNVFDKELLKLQPLDGSYLALLLELGLPGLILILAFIRLIVLHGNEVLKVNIKQDEDDNYKFVKIALAAFLAISLHGIGETYIFVGIQLGSILFWVIAANLSANYYKLKLKNKGSFYSKI